MAFHDDFGLSKGPGIAPAQATTNMSKNSLGNYQVSMNNDSSGPNFWQKAASTLGGILPTIGTALGGPLGSVLGGVAGAGLSAVGQNWQNNVAGQEAAKDRAFQSEEAQKARDYNTQMWNMQNEYNDPSKQFERLKALGVNDATAISMMSGNGAAAGNASSVGSTGAQASGSRANLASTNDFARYVADLPMNVIQNAKAKEETIQKRIENKMKNFEASKQQEQYNIALEQQQQVTEQLKNDVEAGKLDNEMRRKNLNKADVELGILINDLAMSNMDTAAHQQFLDYQLRIQAAEAMLRETQSKWEEKRLIAEIENMKASAASLYANAALAGAQKEGIDLENQMKEFDLRHQGDRYEREVGEYNQRMKNYRTERAMSIATGTVGALCNVAGAVAQFMPTNAVTNVVGHMFGHYNDYTTTNKSYRTLK